jgi:F0F1-type ATP synthase assembly protein I
LIFVFLSKGWGSPGLLVCPWLQRSIFETPILTKATASGAPNRVFGIKHPVPSSQPVNSHILPILKKKMARSHHRKKHKSHLKQFKSSHDTSVGNPKNRARAVSVFTVAGAITGLAIGYFATQGVALWLIVGLLVGGAAGYLIGRRIDGETS